MPNVKNGHDRNQKPSCKPENGECKTPNSSKDLPFTIRKDSKLGRHLVAFRDIEPGEIVITESPLIKGPPQVTGPVCLSCLNNITADDSVECEKCGWPLCREEKCHNNSNHEAECNWTTKIREQKVKIRQFITPHKTYECITAIRCLYTKQNDKNTWNKLNSLESHCNKRKGTEKYENDRMIIAQFLYRFFKIGENDFSESEILKICGIIQVNGHEVPLTEPAHVAIYNVASMLEHSCMPNCCKSFTSDGNILIRATEKIQKGEHITISYTDLLWSSINRLEHLILTKYFYCECLRCKDPTELGTFYSALKCNQEECDGYVVPNISVKENNLPRGTWRCGFCSHLMPTDEVRNALSRIGEDFTQTDKQDPESCKLFLHHYTQKNKTLNRNHYFLTDIRVKLAQLYGQLENQNIQMLSDDDLNHKTELCRQTLALSNVLFPAEWRIRGVLMYELHAAIAEDARRYSTNNCSTELDLLIQKLMESKKWLEEAVFLLKYEPEVLPEGKMAKQAEQNLIDLNSLLQKIHSQIGDAII